MAEGGEEGEGEEGKGGGGVGSLSIIITSPSCDYHTQQPTWQLKAIFWYDL